MTMWIVLLVLIPALWLGWLVSGIAAWVLAGFSPVWGILVPDYVGSVQGGTYLAMVGIGVSIMGNLMMLFEFERRGWRNWWWVDDLLMWTGWLFWLAGVAVMTDPGWWLPIGNGQVVGSVLLAPLGMMVLSGIKSADDSGLITGFKLLLALGILAVVQALVLWLLPVS